MSQLPQNPPKTLLGSALLVLVSCRFQPLGQLPPAWLFRPQRYTGPLTLHLLAAEEPTNSPWSPQGPGWRGHPVLLPLVWSAFLMCVQPVLDVRAMPPGPRFLMLEAVQWGRRSMRGGADAAFLLVSASVGGGAALGWWWAG